MSHKDSYKATPETLRQALRKLNNALSDLPRICPLCSERRFNAAAVAQHNILCAYRICK